MSEALATAQKLETVSTRLSAARERVSLSNILVATDFSAVSETALDYALSIARRYESRIYVAHVVLPTVYQLVGPEAMEATYGIVRKNAEEEMTALLISGRLRNVAHEAVLEEGLLWPTLEKLIRRHSIQLVVVGTHGRTGARKMLLGSAAEEIFRMADCPVMTVGPQAQAEVPKEIEIKKILYATDFSVRCEHAAAYALSLAQEHQAKLTLVHVVEDVEKISTKSIAQLRETYLRQLEDYVTPDIRAWCEPNFLITLGKAEEEILAVAREHEADLIVLGARRAGQFAGHLPPGRAYKVVCQASCPVLTVRG